MNNRNSQLVVKSTSPAFISEEEVFEVETNIVREVDEANYNQVEKTIDALEKANLSTKHALNGLKEGHGYELESYQMKAPVQVKDKRIGETIYGENHLVSYSLKNGVYQVERKDQKFLEGNTSQISGPTDPNSLAVSSQHIQTTNSSTSLKMGKVIEINAISRKVSRQIKSGSGDLIDNDN